jgi:hypothetical protein
VGGMSIMAPLIVCQEKNIILEFFFLKTIENRQAEIMHLKAEWRTWWMLNNSSMFYSTRISVE